MQEKNLILGLGSGRSGTKCLSNLLSAQKNSGFTHELIPHLTWRFSYDLISPRLLTLLDFNAKFIGDVSCYYLNYVPFIASKLPKTKFICIQRPREDTVKSFLSHFQRRDMLTNDPNRERSGVEVCFPKYPITDKALAAGIYWDEYYSKALQLEEAFKNFRIFHIKKLNSKKGVKKILDFAGFEEQVIPKVQRGSRVSENIRLIAPYSQTFTL